MSGMDDAGEEEAGVGSAVAEPKAVGGDAGIDCSAEVAESVLQSQKTIAAFEAAIESMKEVG